MKIATESPNGTITWHLTDEQMVQQLSEANGKTKTHTLTTAADLKACVGKFITLMKDLLISERAGAVSTHRVADPSAGAYKNSVLVTEVVLRAGSTGRVVFLDRVIQEQRLSAAIPVVAGERP